MRPSWSGRRIRNREHVGKDYPGRIVAAMPVGRPKRPAPPGSPKSTDPDYGKFDRALKTPVRPVLLSLQRSPFRDLSAAELLDNAVVVCSGFDPKQPKEKIQSGRGPVETLVIDHIEKPSEN